LSPCDTGDPIGQPSAALIERAARVRLILLDADGVLTDGRLYWAPGGHDGRAFHTRDGLGIRLGQRAGLRFGVISGRECRVVAERGRELSVSEIHQGESDKVGRLREILARLELAAEVVCFVGDDLPDVPVMRQVGLAIAPADAAPEVRSIAHWITERPGGHGAVRDAIELVLRASGKWEQSIEGYIGPEPA
jgi:3-deoxy-D-manno-octulosonate 8-phosphate phosphatase (KDO 8-P phosphatase)